MTNHKNYVIKESNNMKKTLLVAIMAVALVVAFASTAVARPSGDIYKAWTTSIGTPHSGYTTTTTKCAVCHSVHYAATSGSSWTKAGNTWTAETGNTEMLLRSNVANACNYCHITTSIGGVQIYGGLVAAYTTSSNTAHNFATCSECHAVHGADTYAGANAAKILRQMPNGASIQAEVLASTMPATSTITSLFADAAAAYADGNKYNQQVAFCSSCHKEWTTSSDATIQATIYGDPQNEYYKGHAMTGTLNSAVGAPLGNSLAAGTQMAWSGSTQCRSCHDAGGVDQSGVTFNNFPHYTQGYYRFMVSAADDAAANDAGQAFPVAQDGQCVKCHKGSAVTGVGQTY